MIFTETKLKDAYIINLEKMVDERGFFARTYCENEFENVGISFTPVQANVSYNRHKHTLRGIHFQKSPYEEAKLVNCLKGAIYDVIIDLRPSSPTFNEWIGIELDSKNRKMLYVPKGFAHGFLTLKDETEVSYLMSDFYVPGSGRGIRWDDPYYNIKWPVKAKIISDNDKNWPYKS
ncbi:dTDP-4-dehydrorhamnose 3,5-epimerase [Aliifodinibius sp. S!AR15-10]|uniref:dTDP-4-dehydrorhamnose 3,5-epimerase n=1 Tax=Aliifodinibius sp. S!AR15-10 TaxID=2950437 RepID=UPI0028610214|nr:dTDP-4-dehydrorhamnose 3,5-epimerase [Aliifodinibius sp. S!AR15-10]MDR8390229.1 dTDP-4-dehydrorhamnose 3,5-epimerase [Aliifodinibius sp. S!AR15-10]